MNYKEFSGIITEANKRRNFLSVSKGQEYSLEGENYTRSDDADVLRNFKSIGDRLGIEPTAVCLIYLLKQVDALCSLIQRFAKSKKISDLYINEGITSRLDDIRNYADLMECLVVEEEKSRGLTPPQTNALGYVDDDLIEDMEIGYRAQL